jgi:phosphate-selective porin OprO/OprP
MGNSLGRFLGRAAAGGIAALLLTAGWAAASDPSLDELRARMEKLEQQNAELQKQLLTSQQTPSAPTEGGGGLNQKDVKKIVEDALKDQESKKKKTDEEKKAQEEQKKKDAPKKWYEVGSDLNLQAHYKDGRFWLDSAHRDFGVWIGGYVQQDWVWSGMNSALQADPTIGTIEDSTFPRRARIDMFGYAWEQVEWGVELDLEVNPANNLTANQVTSVASGTVPSAGNNPAVGFTDLWVGLKELPVLGNIRFGHIRDPFGLENYSSSMALSFMERGAGFDAFEQEFQPGVWGFRGFLDERLNLAWSIARTDPTQFDVDVGNGDYCFTGRVAGLPFWANNGRCFLHLAADYQYRTGQFDPSIGDHDQRFRARPDIRDEDFLEPRFVDTGTIVSDEGDFLNLEALLVLGPLHIQSEFTQAWVNNANVGGKAVGDLSFNAFYVYAGYFLTGESRAYDKRLLRLGPVQMPNEPFFLVAGEDGHRHWGLGAWEVLFRYDTINLNSGTVRGGAMNTYTSALNWYLNPNLKFMFNYVIADRFVDAPKASGLAHFVGARFQLNF